LKNDNPVAHISDPKHCNLGAMDAPTIVGTIGDSNAASLFPGLPVLDLTDGICGPHTCEPVVGNIIVLRDTQHLTATYSAALAPYFLSLFDAATTSPP
jgi:hypothetical protein